MPRVLKGLQSGNGSGSMHLTSREDPNGSKAVAVLNQDGFNITLLSVFGLFHFFKEDTEIVADSLRSLADLIEEKVKR